MQLVLLIATVQEFERLQVKDRSGARRQDASAPNYVFFGHNRLDSKDGLTCIGLFN